MSDLLILDKSEIKKLESDNDTAYEDLQIIVQRSREPDAAIDEQINRIADNMAKIFDGNGHSVWKENICSIIQRNLEIKNMGFLSSRVYRLLPPEHKQKAKDHSSSRSVSPDSEIKYPQQYENYLKELKNACNLIKNLDPSYLRRQDIQEVQSEVAELDIGLRNICNDKDITLIESTHKMDLSRSTKKQVQHLKYLPRKSTKLLEVYKKEMFGLSDDIYQLANVSDKFPPEEEDLPRFIKSIRIWRKMFKPWIDAKHHLDWLGWFEVKKRLKYYSVNKVADLTKITDDNGQDRAMTPEAIQNWLQSDAPKFFEEYVKHCPGIFDLCLWYKTTLPAKYGLTNRMWDKVKSVVKK